MVCVIPKFNQTTPFLIKLHWLPVFFRIQFKILLLVFKALEGKAPVYIRDLLKTKVAGGYALRSDNQRLLQVPKTKCKSFGDRAFAHSGPSLWNALPLELRLIQEPLWLLNLFQILTVLNDILKPTCSRKLLELNNFDFFKNIFLFQCCILLM